MVSMNPVSWAQEQDVIGEILNLTAYVLDEQSPTDPEQVEVKTDCPACGGAGTVEVNTNNAPRDPQIRCTTCKYVYPLVLECVCGGDAIGIPDLWSVCNL
jgi:hypothetical protein